MVELIKKWKYPIIGVSATAIIFVGLFTFSQLTAQAETLDQVEAIVADVDALYTDETKTMLAEGATIEQVTAIEDDIANIDSKSLSGDSEALLKEAETELSYAKQMVELRDAANALLKDGILVEGADITTVETMATELNEFKPEYVASITPTITEAKTQQEAIATATKNVNALFTDETLSTVRSDVTRSEYDTAQSSVDVIKNKTSKDTLQKSLNTVDVFLDEQEAIAQAEVEKAEQEQSAKSENTSSSSSNSSSDNGSNSSSSSSSKNGSSSNGSSGSSGSGSSGGDESWSGEIELEVDYYTINHDAIDTQGNPIPEVYDMRFETEEEMFTYMNSNYPGCGYSYTIHYKTIEM